MKTKVDWIKWLNAEMGKDLDPEGENFCNVSFKKTAYLPGPWVVDNETDWCFVREAATGYPIARACISWDEDYLDECRREEKVPEPAASHARLIAALPDVLEALELAQEMLDNISQYQTDYGMGYDKYYYENMKTIQKALDKAKGTP